MPWPSDRAPPSSSSSGSDQRNCRSLARLPPGDDPRQGEEAPRPRFLNKKISRGTIETQLKGG
jgi:hypothetical protein